MNKELLKEYAEALEHEFRRCEHASREVSEFSHYPPVVDAIERAKKGAINFPEHIRGIQFWQLETSIFWDFHDLAEAFSKFHLTLKGLDSEISRN